MKKKLKQYLKNIFNDYLLGPFILTFPILIFIIILCFISGAYK